MKSLYLSLACATFLSIPQAKACSVTSLGGSTWEISEVLKSVQADSDEISEFEISRLQHLQQKDASYYRVTFNDGSKSQEINRLYKILMIDSTEKGGPDCFQLKAVRVR